MKLKKVQILTLPTDFKAVGVVSPIHFTIIANRAKRIYTTSNYVFSSASEEIK